MANRFKKIAFDFKPPRSNFFRRRAPSIFAPQKLFFKIPLETFSGFFNSFNAATAAPDAPRGSGEPGAR